MATEPVASVQFDSRASKVKRLLGLFKILIGLALVGYLISLIDFGELLSVIRQASQYLLVVAFATFGIARCADATRLTMLASMHGLRWLSALRIVMGTVFFNNLSTSVVGDGYRIWALRAVTYNWKAPVTYVVLERLTGMAVIFLAGAIYVLLFPSKASEFIGSADLTVRTGLMTIVLGAAGVLLILCWIFLRVATTYRDYVIERLRDVYYILRDIGLRRFAWVLLMTVASQALTALMVYVLAVAVHGEVRFLDVVFVMLLTWAAMYIPISVGALGVREAILVLGLTSFGLTRPTAAAVAFISRIIIYIYAVFGGLTIMLASRTSRDAAALQPSSSRISRHRDVAHSQS